MRDSVNLRMWDDGLDSGMPRIGIEAIGSRWDTPDVQCNVAFGDGRVLLVFGQGTAHHPIGSDGRPRVRGAGPLSFELVEPFAHWRMRLDGSAVVTTAQNQIAGELPADTERVPVATAVDIRSVVPPFENGTRRQEAARVMAEQEEGILIGGSCE